LGPQKKTKYGGVKTNEELDKLIKHKNIINPLNAELNPICHLLALLGAHHILHVSRIRVNYIKAQRLSWFGHVQRMPDTRTVKKIFNWKLLTKRLQG
jgi:hypothetical protein